MSEPTAESLAKIKHYIAKYREKTGTFGLPEVEEAVSLGLASNLDSVGKPLCPCNFYPSKETELKEHGRRWVCACDEMRLYKYCHCLLFARPDGMPITEYLPEGHEGREIYGVLTDPTPNKGRK